MILYTVDSEARRPLDSGKGAGNAVVCAVSVLSSAKRFRLVAYGLQRALTVSDGFSVVVVVVVVVELVVRKTSFFTVVELLLLLLCCCCRRPRFMKERLIANRRRLVDGVACVK